MKKVEWENLYRNLEEIYFEFGLEYDDMLYGRNLKIRNSASRKVKSNIKKAIFFIQQNEQIIHLMTHENSTEYSSQINWEEFMKPEWFNKDLPRLLEKIEEKIINADLSID